jgi:GMP synthase-like glutamine amidotransferase
MSVQLCILETDELHPQLAEPYVSYGQMFANLFSNQPVPASTEVFNVCCDQYPSADCRFDAYLITGSKADAFSDEPWVVRLREYVRERFIAGDKLLGICFGHQLLAHSLGGHAGRSEKGWGLGVQKYQLHAQPAWMQPPLPGLQLQASHQDQVHKLPEGAQLLASNDFCNHAAYHIGDQLLCFQGHPEFPEGYARALLDLRRERLGDELHAAASATLHQEHHGRIVGEWMLRFVRGY